PGIAIRRRKPTVTKARPRHPPEARTRVTHVRNSIPGIASPGGAGYDFLSKQSRVGWPWRTNELGAHPGSDTKRLGGLGRRPSFLSFRVTTTTSKPTCLRRRLQHTQLGTEISRLLSWPAS